MAETKKVTRLSTEVRNFIIERKGQGFSCLEIERLLSSELSVKTTRKSIHNFLERYNSSGSVTDSSSRKGIHVKVNRFHKKMIDLWLSKDPEMTSRKLKEKLFQEFHVQVSEDHISRLRKQMGWTAVQAKYCQLITHKNRKVRVDWCLGALDMKERFHNVIFSDETSVEMCSSGRLYFFKKTSDLQHLPAKKQKPKHSYKVNVWGGISYRGRTDICVFTGIMDSVIYQNILQEYLLPFTQKVFPDGYRFYQDNDSKHKSKSTVSWMEAVGMMPSVIITPASSPDINPIENVWSHMKHYLQHEVKPKKKDELVNGIKQFWEGLTAEKCARFIDHIHKVLPYVVLNEGHPSGF